MRQFIPVLIAGLLSAGLALVVVRIFGNQQQVPAQVPPGHSLVSAAAKGMSSVVFIYNLASDTSTVFGEHQTGSGVVISPDGYIITNQHVINGAHSIHVYMHDRREYTAVLIGADTSQDVALIKIEADSLSFLGFGNSDSVQVGEQVLAIGNPLRLQSTVTSGIVSARERTIKLGTNTTPYYIQTDVPLNVGNSGGALINAKGELIGLNIAYMSVTGAYEGFSFAIPGNIVKKITDDIRQYGANRKASIGITIHPVSEDDAAAAQMTTLDGVVVYSVDAGGAADRSGLRSLDVITSFNGKAVIGVSDFKEQLALARPGEVVKFGVNRGAERVVVEVKLE